MENIEDKTEKEESSRKIAIENADAKDDISELDNDEIIRYSKKIGVYYVSLIENISGKGQLNDEALSGLPDAFKDKMREYIQCINRNRELQHLRFELKDNAAQSLVSEAAEAKGLEKELAETAIKKYEMEEISRGVFVMYMDKDLFSMIYGEKIAVATINKKGISFVAMPRECKIGADRDFLFLENLFHEFHHVVWSFFVADGKIVCDEEDAGVKFCYEYLQDEIIAKLASDGGMACYTALPFDKKSSEEFRSNYLGKEEKIKAYLSELNKAMCDELMPFMQEIGVNKQDLIYSVMEASNFKDLKANLRRFKAALESKLVDKKRNEPVEENPI
jgi:hypothetical protein